jgi:D-alanyl-D-alanine carboxypeptidase
MRIRSSVFMLAAVLISVAAAQETAPPATAHLTEYIAVFNSGRAEKMLAFIQARYADPALRQSPAADRVSRYAATKARFQSLRLQKILVEQPGQTYALARAGNGETFLLRASVEKEAPHKLLFIFFEPVEDPDDIVIPDPKNNNDALVTAIREYVAAQAKADEFSGVVLVAADSRILFHEAYGYADRTKKTPNRKDTKFNLGSINKNFTRAAILQLENKGKLQLSDPIKKFLPDYPNRQAAEKVTIRHLLDMTSGIGDFFGRRYDATPKEQIRNIPDYLPLFADLPLEFEPGTNNRYSNGGYIVLGAIIEKITGVDYYTYVRENIFIPCDMLGTESYERDKEIPNRALGYTRERGSGSERVLNYPTLPGRGSSAGGGYSTATDLLKYVLALKEGKIRLPDVGNGLAIAGGAPGINADLEWDPRSGYIVIVLSNFDPPTAGSLARRILSWLPQQ